MNTKQKIFSFIREKERVTAKNIIDYFQLSPQIIHRYLKTLQEDGLVDKIGTPPKVIYKLVYGFERDQSKIKVSSVIRLPKNVRDTISENFITISPSGNINEGIWAFANWCIDSKRNLDITKSALEYIRIFQEYEILKDKNGFIKITSKINKKGNTENYLDEIFSLDYYALPQFGKTRLAAQLFYAKQSSDKEYIDKILLEVTPKIQKLIEVTKVDAIGFIPPSIPRKVQFMKELQKRIITNLPIIRIEKLPKVHGKLIVQQKSLKSTNERIENARETIFINSNQRYSKILLIDDFIASGSTLNEVSKKLKDSKQASNIIGFGIASSIKGFEVINEV